jgi:hypothetical protein
MGSHKKEDLSFRKSPEVGIWHQQTEISIVQGVEAFNFSEKQAS